jgi:hypothetical protein
MVDESIIDVLGAWISDGSVQEIPVSTGSSLTWRLFKQKNVAKQIKNSVRKRMQGNTQDDSRGGTKLPLL